MFFQRSNQNIFRHLSATILSLLIITVPVLITSCGGGGSGAAGTDYYVSYAGGSDSNPGTQSEPFLTIQTAVDTASAGDKVMVAGTTSDYGTVALKEGVELYGGYSADWSIRDPNTYLTFLKGTGDLTGAAIRGGTSITRSTIVDGFIVTGGSGGTSGSAYGVALNGASPVISNSSIYGGDLGATISVAVFCDNGASPLLTNDFIRAANGSSSTGIHNKLSSPEISNSIIYGGYGGLSSRGIFNEIQSSPVINNSTISGGVGTVTYGIINNSNSNATITSSTVSASTGTTDTGYGIYNSSSSPVIRNSTISGSSFIDASESYGVFNTGSSVPSIKLSSINGGKATDPGGYSYGLYSSGNSQPSLTESTVSGGTAKYSYGLYLKDTTTQSLRLNTIDGGLASRAYGVYLSSGAAPVMDRNIIKSQGGGWQYGVYVDSPGTAATLRNNLIQGGTGPSSYGIYVFNGDPKIYNNTVDGGDGANYTAAIHLGNNNAEIVNNILFNSGTSGVRFCIQELDYNILASIPRPLILANNDLFDCGTALYRSWTWVQPIYPQFALWDISSISTLNSLSVASVNTSADPVLAAKNGNPEAGSWNLTVSSPNSVIYGGTDLSSTFIGDYLGQPRMYTWSIGAYERN